MNSNEKGDIGLSKVIADVVSKGYFIFLPLSDRTHVDLIIANKKMNLKRIQIKYISINKGGVLSIVTSTVINGKKTPMDLSQTDIWAIYCPDNDKIYYVSTNELLYKKTFNLRINKPKQIQKNINYGNDYLSFENVWC